MHSPEIGASFGIICERLKRAGLLGVAERVAAAHDITPAVLLAVTGRVSPAQVALFHALVAAGQDAAGIARLLGWGEAAVARELGTPEARPTPSPKSGPRLAASAALRGNLEVLREHRSRLLAEVRVLDDMISDGERLCSVVESLELAPTGSASPEMEHLVSFGEHGAIVLRIAANHGVALHHLLGPGAPGSPEARIARRDAAIALAEQAGIGCAVAARILRVSGETARRLQLERKTAA